VLASVGCGWYATVDEACAVMVNAETVASPGRDAAVYSTGYPIYRSLYPLLADTFHSLGSAG
jgi:sugar (pentulose or hexulose) kinase